MSSFVFFVISARLFPGRWVRAQHGASQLRCLRQDAGNKQHRKHQQRNGRIELDVVHDQQRAGQGRQEDQRPIKQHHHQQGAHHAANNEAQPRPILAPQGGGQIHQRVTAGNEAGQADGQSLQEDRKERADYPRDHRNDQHHQLGLALEQVGGNDHAGGKTGAAYEQPEQLASEKGQSQADQNGQEHHNLSLEAKLRQGRGLCKSK
jgi:hypothetical protein